jgi:hypothetical protein
MFGLLWCSSLYDACFQVIRNWRHNGGVLLIGYELYRLLSLRRDKLSKKKKFVSLIDVDEDDNRKKALWSGKLTLFCGIIT